MSIRRLASALADMRDIKTYLAERNPEAARQVVARIRHETKLLAAQPNIGRMGRLPDTRELIIGPYPYIVA